MGKQFKATSKLTAKFLVVLMVLQATLFAFTAFAETAPAAVTIKKGTTEVSGTTLVGFIGVPIALVATPNTAVTTAAYKLNYWHSSNTTSIPVTTGNTAAKSFTPAAKGTGVVLSVYNAVDLTGPTNTVTVNVYSKLLSFTIPNAGKLTVKVGQTGYIGETVLTPTTADVTTTVYSLSTVEAAKGVITVDSVTGAVYAIKSGLSTVTVTKTLPDGTTKFKTFVVTVPEPVNTVSISTDGKNAIGTTLGINAGKKTTLKAIVTSLTGGTKAPTDKTVVWSLTGDSGIAIDSKTGVISLTDLTDATIGKTAVVTATAKDTWNAASDTVTITVGKDLKSISVTKSTYLLKVGADKIIIPVLKSSNDTAPTVPSVTYTAETGKEAILTVGLTTGIIHPVAASSTSVKITVKATAADGTFKTTIVTVTVVADVTAITLAQPATTTALKPLKLYSKASIKATVTPSSLKLNAVRYTSVDPSIAYVNPYTGEITATGVGNTTISASADGVISNAIVVYVTDPDGLLIAE